MTFTQTETQRLKTATRTVSQWSMGDQQRWYSLSARHMTAYVTKGVWLATNVPSMRVLASLIDGRRSVEERRIVVNALRRIRAAGLENIV